MKCINNRLSFSINRHFLLLSALREPRHQIYGRSIGLLSEVALQLPISYNINVSAGRHIRVHVCLCPSLINVHPLYTAYKCVNI